MKKQFCLFVIFSLWGIVSLCTKDDDNKKTILEDLISSKSNTNLKIEIGGDGILNIIISSINSNNTPIWSSESQKIAILSNKGLVVAISKSTIKVAAKINNFRQVIIPALSGVLSTNYTHTTTKSNFSRYIISKTPLPIINITNKQNNTNPKA